MAISEKRQNSFVAIFGALTVPIIILNLFGGIISVIWLAILGGKEEILKGIGLMIISPIFISGALTLCSLFAAPAVMAIEKGKKLLGIFLESLGVLYIFALITIWFIGIMWLFFLSSATESSLIPLLIWSYEVALAPWMWLAHKIQQDDGQQYDGNNFLWFGIFFAQISYILGMILFFFGATLHTIAVIFGAIMLIGAILQVIIAFGGEVKRAVKKSFSEKEVKEALGILEEASKEFGSGVFDLVKENVEKSILSNTEQFLDVVRKGRSVRKCVYSIIANTAADLVESGHYHIYRGILTGPGEDLLKIFDAAIDELVRLGDIDLERAKKEKAAVRENIEAMG